MCISALKLARFSYTHSWRVLPHSLLCWHTVRQTQTNYEDIYQTQKKKHTSHEKKKDFTLVKICHLCFWFEFFLNTFFFFFFLNGSLTAEHHSLTGMLCLVGHSKLIGYGHTLNSFTWKKKQATITRSCDQALLFHFSFFKLFFWWFELQTKPGSANNW